MRKAQMKNLFSRERQINEDDSDNNDDDNFDINENDFTQWWSGLEKNPQWWSPDWLTACMIKDRMKDLLSKDRD